MESNIRHITIKSAERGSSETVAAEQLTPDSYRLVENPVFNCRINYGTVIRAREENGSLVMSSILRASTFKTRQFFIDPNYNTVDWGKQIGNPIIEAGGMWEIVMGGICFIHLPKTSTFDLDNFFQDKGYYPSEIINDSEGGV
jgi:hypothetical protein